MQRWVMAVALGILGVAGLGLAVARKAIPSHPTAPASVSTESGSGSPQAASGPAGPALVPTEEPVRVLLARAETARIQGAYAQARQLYQQVLQQNPDAQVAAQAQEKLGEVNVKLLLSPAIGPDAVAYRVQPGDTLSKIAQRFGTTVELIRAANRLPGDLIQAGRELKVVSTPFAVIVDKSQNQLLLRRKEEVVKVYRCSTGEGGTTPIGQFRIVSRLVDPVWKGIVPPGDPKNPLGSRWLGFDLPQYGIHGTNDPSSIGRPVTHGCVRLANADAEELFILLPEGTAVTIVE